VLERVLIVGGGVAAMRCALELRTQGYGGRICMVAAEATPPYDRTLVSKAPLSGDRVDDARLLLQPSEAYEDAAIDLRLGVRATGLDVRMRQAVAQARREIDAPPRSPAPTGETSRQFAYSRRQGARGLRGGDKPVTTPSEAEDP
jgi:3-phenylpropionate/trans-cinnamate dioxygenase ferredoxin reductase component